MLLRDYATMLLRAVMDVCSQINIHDVQAGLKRSYGQAPLGNILVQSGALNKVF